MRFADIHIVWTDVTDCRREVMQCVKGAPQVRIQAWPRIVKPGYGDGMVERVLQLGMSARDLILDAGPIRWVLPDLCRIAGGDGRRLLTVSNHGPAAEELGVRSSFEGELRYNVLGDFAKLAAKGRFIVPVARTFLLEEWREALDLSLSGHAHGKLILFPAGAIARD